MSPPDPHRPAATVDRAVADPGRGGSTAALDDSVLLRESRRRRNIQAPIAFAVVAGSVIVLTVVSGVAISVYGIVALSYLGIKLGLSIAYRPSDGEPVGVGTVGLVVPFFNEDPPALRACLASVLAQTRRLDRIYAVDDGSDSTACLDVARRVLSEAGHEGAVVHRLPANVGKRHAQAWAMRRMDCAIVVTVDSDTVLHPDAVREGLRGFADPEVMAVTGNVQAHNADTNLLTRLTSLRYANAFLWERAAYSAVGSVLCACGSLSLWRRELIEERLEEYTRQTFLGVPVMYGDDRRLTNYALTRGKVLFQETAIAYTTVPDRFSHYIRQQLRWNKSFFRETLWALRRFRPWTAVWLLSFGEIALWICFTVALVVALVVIPLLTGAPPSAWYLGFVAAMAYARSVRYLGSQRSSMLRQVGIFALAPVYGLLYLTILMPIRFWALFTLRRPGWGTRAVVEVEYQDSPSERSPLAGDQTIDGFSAPPARAAAGQVESAPVSSGHSPAPQWGQGDQPRST